MLDNLRAKFLALLLAVTFIGLSSALLVRTLFMKDFREYMQGEMEDRVYLVMADLEGTYDKYSGWDEETLAEDMIWALMMGLELKVLNTDGEVVMSTEKALDYVPPSMKRRVESISDKWENNRDVDFIPYPLFLRGEKIGRLEVRFLKPRKLSVFMERSNRFLILCFLVIGGLSILVSIVFSKKLTRPLVELTEAAKSISEGNIKHRVSVERTDEIGKLAASFNKMAESLELQETLRKKLTSNVAHELRTPLAAILGELEGMIDGIIPVSKTHLASLHEEAKRLKRILEGCEELTSAQASALSLRKCPLDLREFLGKMKLNMERLFEEKEVSLEISCEEALTINADPDRLSQILLNLLNNSLKATDRGGKVSVKAGKHGNETFISVEDTGCGIKQEDLPFIFERFYKAGNSDGLGIGLTIVKELVDAHGGRIDVKSEHGKWTRFTIFFPEL